MKHLSTLLAMLLLIPSLWGQNVPVQEFVLDNGMKLLMVPRKGNPNIAAGWIAKVGSVNERPGITGISHLFEHMMFKGTHTIGTSNIREELKLIDEMDAIKNEIRKEEQVLTLRQRLGEIKDINDPKNRAPHHQALLAELGNLQKREKDLIVKDEFDRIYTSAGASGMNAGTDQDWTLYFINVPANKLELWFWMESDRLSNPVFREFYSERDVVREERRLRTESTPTGKFQEQFESMFWQASPYGWPVVGWPSDLDGITREEAKAYFDINYAPNNISACLVGDFEPSQAIELAKKYFGRLKRGPRDPEPVRTREIKQEAEGRMIAYAETNPEALIRYHTVADGHKDEPALRILADLLNGRTGRLYKSLVLEQGLANNTSAESNGRKYEGYFEIRGVAKPGKTPEEVEKAIYKELDKLKKELVNERELQKVKNQNAAGDFRRLQSNFALMFQLLIYDSGRGWPHINTDPKLVQAVTAKDVLRVANQYFSSENPTVAIYYRKKAEGAEPDSLLTKLSDEERQQVQMMKSRVGQLNKEQVQQFLEQLQQQVSQSPPDKQELLQAMRRILEARLRALEGAK
ncbi:MAG: insulinase family protein [Acidobacteria bacterium]|nr:MAG: insulinase family protein [Acidobacteriota bacterium]